MLEIWKLISGRLVFKSQFYLVMGIGLKTFCIWMMVDDDRAVASLFQVYSNKGKDNLDTWASLIFFFF